MSDPAPGGTGPKTEAPPFEKEVVRLPDGRELTYYRFPDPSPRAEQEPDGEAADGERRPRRMSLGRSEQGDRGSRGSPSEAAGSRGSPATKER